MDQNIFPHGASILIGKDRQLKRVSYVVSLMVIRSIEKSVKRVQVCVCVCVCEGVSVWVCVLRNYNFKWGGNGRSK